MFIAKEALYRRFEPNGSKALDVRSLLAEHRLDDVPRDGQWDLLSDFLRVRQEKLEYRDPRFQSVRERFDLLPEDELERLRPCIVAIREATVGNNQDDKKRKGMVERNLATPGEGSLTGKTDSI